MNECCALLRPVHRRGPGRLRRRLAVEREGPSAPRQRDLRHRRRSICSPAAGGGHRRAPLTVSGYGDIDRNSYALEVRATGSSATALATASTTIARKDHQTVVVSSNGGAPHRPGADRRRRRPEQRLRQAAHRQHRLDRRRQRSTSTSSPTPARPSPSAVAPFASGVSGLQAAYSQVTRRRTPSHVCVTSPGDKTDLRLDLPLTFSDKRIVTLILVRTGGGFFLNGLVLDQQGALVAGANSSARVRVAASLGAGRVGRRRRSTARSSPPACRRRTSGRT